MKKFIIGLIAATIVIATLILWACSNNEEKSVSCGPPVPNDDIEVEFDILGKSFISEVKIFKYDINENATGIEFAHCKTNEDLLLFVEYYCHLNNIKIDNNMLGIILYYDLPISNSNKVDDANIMGISLFTVNGYKITHNLYTKNDKSEFCEEENVKIAVSGIYSNHIHFYLENYVFQNPQNKSFILFEGNFPDEFNKNRSKYRVPFKFEIKSKTRGNPNQQNGCESPCTSGYSPRCDLATYSCFSEAEPGCSCEEAAYSTRGTQYQKFFKEDLMHNFKDNFLYRFSKGTEYIENYYFLSSEYIDKISIDLAIKTALVLIEFNPIMEDFLNVEMHPSKIIIDDNLFSLIMNLIDEYEKITESGYGKGILDAIRDDIKRMKNLTLKEILALFT
jgi:hypothetical protein